MAVVESYDVPADAERESIAILATAYAGTKVLHAYEPISLIKFGNKAKVFLHCLGNGVIQDVKIRLPDYCRTAPGVFESGGYEM